MSCTSGHVILTTECPIEDRAKCQVPDRQRLHELSFCTYDIFIYLKHAYLAYNICIKCIISFD